MKNEVVTIEVLSSNRSEVWGCESDEAVECNEVAIEKITEWLKTEWPDADISVESTDSYSYVIAIDENGNEDNDVHNQINYYIDRKWCDWAEIALNTKG